MRQLSEQVEAARKFLTFVNASPTPFHAVQNAALKLEQAGFKKLRESDDWGNDLKSGGKYYFTRNQSSLLAFTLPQSWRRGTGLSIVATHVDSPNLRVRPFSKRTSSGYLQVGVETYGSGLWHTYLDRDLSVAGRVIIREKDETFSSKLIHVKQPIMRIPSLAIHLNRNVNEGLKFNLETEFQPTLGLMTTELNAPSNDSAGLKEQDAASSIKKKHHSTLLSLIAKEFSVEINDIFDFELALYDTQPSCFGGIDNEFLLSARMDNLVSSFCAVEALATTATSVPETDRINCIALFNHEEVGSSSSTGAQSTLIPTLLQRLSSSPTELAQSTSRSFVISADMTHAVHPNYANKHEEVHKPTINGGVVLKTNAGQKYATDAIGSFVIKKLLDETGGRVQEYEARNDIICGSTIGPFLSRIGVQTVDVGLAMLSMHSIREMAGSHDVQHMLDLFSSFYSKYPDLEKSVKVD